MDTICDLGQDCNQNHGASMIRTETIQQKIQRQKQLKKWEENKEILSVLERVGALQKARGLQQPMWPAGHQLGASATCYAFLKEVRASVIPHSSLGSKGV